MDSSEYELDQQQSTNQDSSDTPEGAVVTDIIYILKPRWRSLKSQKRVLALFCSKNLQRNSPDEREKQATATKVIITRLVKVLNVLQHENLPSLVTLWL